MQYMGEVYKQKHTDTYLYTQTVCFRSTRLITRLISF